MNAISIFTLKALRKIYIKALGGYKLPEIIKETNPDKASDLIYNLLASDKPCMIARLGSTELSTIVNYLGIKSKKHSILKFIKGEQPEWWWNKNIMNQMEQWSGFFPSTKENLSKFSELMLNDLSEVDILGSWMSKEYYIKTYISNNNFIHLRLLEPFWSKNPWTRVLKGKKILIVHPFSEEILSQYINKKKLLFKNPLILPDFEILTFKAVQSLGGENETFKNWFDALEYMKENIDKIDYDICLLGCGAYGFPLAAHIKRTGKKAFHLGGALQLLFGIKGKRWEDPSYGVKAWGIPYGSYSSLMNEYWIRPQDKNKPRNTLKVEGGCYW